MGTRTQHVLRLTLLACLALVIGGCTTKVAYNYLDWGISWKVQRLVNLDGEQKEQTKRAIRKFHAWHRKTQLPQYADYLIELKERVNEGDITAAQIHRETDKVQLLLDESIAFVLPDAVAVLSQLSQANTDELLSNIAKKREEYIEEYVDVSQKKRIENRYDKFHSNFKDWLGRPSRKQEKQIKAWAKNLEPFEEAAAEQREALEQRLAALLAKRQDAEALEQGLKELAFYRSENLDKDLKSMIDRNQERTYEVIADLLNNMSDRQRQHFNKKIDGFVEVFTDLYKESK